MAIETIGDAAQDSGHQLFPILKQDGRSMNEQEHSENADLLQSGSGPKPVSASQQLPTFNETSLSRYISGKIFMNTRSVSPQI